MFGFELAEFVLDTSSISDHIPLFAQELGEELPLKINIFFKDISVMLGKFGVDAIVDYTTCFNVFVDH